MALLSDIRRGALRDRVSMRAISRRTGLSRNTIRKYLRSGAVEPKFKVPDRPSKLDRFADKVSHWLKVEAGKPRKQKRTVKHLHTDLVALGYEGSYGRVAAFVREWQADRQCVRQTTGRGVCVPLVFQPGEVFQFEIESPVTIERQRSAMIPIISSNITGRRVSIYSQTDGRPNPMRGVEIVNESNLQLLPGPISVFDAAAYAGDAQIGHISKGDKRLLAYSVDLDVNVLTRAQNASTTTRLKIVDGMILRTISSTTSLSYAFDNKDPKRARTIIVEQPRMDGWNLVEPKKPLEETQQLYRFEVPVEAGKTAAFSVTQERTESESVAIASYDMPSILGFHKGGKLSSAVLKAIEEVGRRQAEINTVEREIAELDRQKNEIDAEQSRIRENMAKIDRASQLYTRYMTKLTDQENTLEDLRERRKAAGARLETLRVAFNEHLRTLNVE